jgi:hypothetical protein
MPKRLPDAADGTTHRLATTLIICHCKLKTNRKLAEEDRNINSNFIFLSKKGLKPLLYEFISARWVSRNVGTDVRKIECFTKEESIDIVLVL